jgi:hypothetical protein
LGILSITANAQTKDSLQYRIDSLRNESEKYVIDTSVSLVIKKTEAVTQIINNIKEILRRGFDTTILESALPETEMNIQNIQTNLFAKFISNYFTPKLKRIFINRLFKIIGFIIFRIV